MKARVISSERRMMEAFAKDMWQGMLSAVLDSEGLMCVAAKRFFKLGNKRMNDFLECVEEVKREFDEHGKDGIFDVMLKREFDEINIDIRKYLVDKETLDHAMNRIEKTTKPEVSRKEAENIQNQMQSFRNVLR